MQVRNKFFIASLTALPLAIQILLQGRSFDTIMRAAEAKDHEFR
jgi:hypothetical protein